MRGKKATLNTFFNLLEEIVVVICGFILPRLILSGFGSRYNGLITSITQFLACAVLLRSGIGGATRAALYKPFATHDKDKIDGIVKATDNFMKKIGIILGVAILAAATWYPFLVKTEFDWFFTFSLFLIIGASTFAESFFGITYLIVLQADQNLWITSVMRMICCVLNTIIAAILIMEGASIHIVKLGSAIIYVLYPIVLSIYVKKKYCINKNVKPDNEAISQRWDAFWQQVAAFVMNNTDVMVLTVFSNMLEVSVYGIYNMIVAGLKRAINAFTSGLEAAFGDMIAKSEDKILKENVSIIETLIFAIATIMYSCAALLIIDFVKIYTNGIDDANYIRPIFAYLIIAAQFVAGTRLPYQLVVQAAGHYKQTKRGAIIEPIINISLSIIFVYKFGLVGVAVGTLAATIFRTLQYSYYMSKYIVKRSQFITYIRFVLSIVEVSVIVIIYGLINLSNPNSYLAWISNALIAGAISFVIVISMNLIFYRNDVLKLAKKLKRINK